MESQVPQFLIAFQWGRIWCGERLCLAWPK